MNQQANPNDQPNRAPAPTVQQQIEKMRKEVKELQEHAQMPRMKVSDCVKDLFAFMEENKPGDYLMRDPAAASTQANPWQEKKKCGML